MRRQAVLFLRARALPFGPVDAPFTFPTGATQLGQLPPSPQLPQACRLAFGYRDRLVEIGLGSGKVAGVRPMQLSANAQQLGKIPALAAAVDLVDRFGDERRGLSGLPLTPEDARHQAAIIGQLEARARRDLGGEPLAHGGEPIARITADGRQPTSQDRRRRVPVREAVLPRQRQQFPGSLLEVVEVAEKLCQHV